MQESSALEAEYNHRPSDPGTPNPSFLLSLGTGRADIPPARADHSWANWWSSKPHGRFVGRLFASVKRHTTGHDFWADFASKHASLVKEEKAWRFEPILPPDLLQLDNPDSIPRLIALTSEHFARWPHKAGMMAAVIANMFRFRLRSTPTFAYGRIVVRGEVCCTWGPPLAGWDDHHHGFAAWSRLLQSEQLQVFVSGRYEGTLRADQKGRWSCPATAELASRTDTFRIEVRGTGQRMHHIDNSPYSISTLLKHDLCFLPSEDNFADTKRKYRNTKRAVKRARSC